MDELENGRDGPNLRMLAGLNEHAYEVEVEECFALVLRDLEQRPIGDAERRLGEARAAAAALLRGELDPVECTRLVHRIAVGPLSHPAVLQPWCDLDGGFLTLEGNKVRRLSGDLLREQIVRYARDFQAVDPGAQLDAIEREL